jgi:hypothetical protein
MEHAAVNKQISKWSNTLGIMSSDSYMTRLKRDDLQQLKVSRSLISIDVNTAALWQAAVHLSCTTLYKSNSLFSLYVLYTH